MEGGKRQFSGTKHAFASFQQKGIESFHLALVRHYYTECGEEFELSREAHRRCPNRGFPGIL